MKTNAFLLFAAALAAFAGCRSAKVPAYDTLVAHRGESHDAPENTLPAYRMAVERGFGFECDVYLSADGRVFTFHDGDLARTSGGKLSKRCTEANWETEISALDVGGWGKWKGSKFEGTRPALLEEVCALARDGRKIYCEVKGGDVRVVGPIRKILEGQSTATPENFLFIAFSDKICRALKEEMPQYKVYWLTGNYHYTWPAGKPAVRGAAVTADEIVAKLRETKADGVDIYFDPELHAKAFVRAVHDAGFEFHVWTIDDPDRAFLAFERGADSVTTNRAKHLLDAWNARAGK